jgi:hypothetical protein
LFTISAQLRKSSPEVTELAGLDTKHTAATNKLVHTDLMYARREDALPVSGDTKWETTQRDRAKRWQL